MGRKAEGHHWTNADGSRSARVTVHGKRQTFRLSSAVRTDEAADARTLILATQAARMRTVLPDAVRAALETIADANTPMALEGAVTVVEQLITGWRPSESVPLLQDLGEQWTDGVLHKRHKDHIRARRGGMENEAGLLAKHVYPYIGRLPVDAVTLDACELVAQRMPDGMAKNSRVNVLALLPVK